MSKLLTLIRFKSLYGVAFALAILAGPLPGQESNVVGGKSQNDDTLSAAATQPNHAPAPPDVTPLGLAPRFELHIPSLSKLVSAVQRSHAGALARAVGAMMLEMGSASAESLDVEGASAILRQIADWPETTVDVATYAPDITDRLRWALRLDLPLRDLHARLQQVLDSEAGRTIFEAVTLHPRAEGGYLLTLPDAPVAYLSSAGDARCSISSHPGLKVPPAAFWETSAQTGDSPALLVAHLDRRNTEQDSGATFFSKFHIITAVDYTGLVDQQGDWRETVRVDWPPVTGMGAKVLFGKVKQTFFVPKEAFGAVALRPMGLAEVLEGFAGFGPQMMVEEGSGEFSITGDLESGPIARRGGSESCITVLPGTGFLPVPDFVVQLRMKKKEGFVEELRQATEKINELYRQREQPVPWHETEVAGRPVFWSDGSQMFPGTMMMPWIMRPVLFATRETDAKERQRDFLVVAWTSTSPERFVRRWLGMPRNTPNSHLPTSRKTNGQVWVNWRQVYKWVHPYVNLALSGVIRDALLPGAEELASDMDDAMITVKIKYAGLDVRHQGPIPVGTLVLPAMVAVSTMEDTSGGSDLARERLAARRLQILYHHCKLFQKDQGRLPAELAELDGYIDFAGHPELLKLQLSSRKRWIRFFAGVVKSEDDEPQSEEDEDQGTVIDDKLYVIRWGRDSWSLGLAPGTLEHLEQLYIDQDGQIHRVEKEESKESSELSDQVVKDGVP